MDRAHRNCRLEIYAEGRACPRAIPGLASGVRAVVTSQIPVIKVLQQGFRVGRIFIDRGSLQICYGYLARAGIPLLARAFTLCVLFSFVYVSSLALTVTESLSKPLPRSALLVGPNCRKNRNSRGRLETGKNFLSGDDGLEGAQPKEEKGGACPQGSQKSQQSQASVVAKNFFVTESQEEKAARLIMDLSSIRDEDPEREEKRRKEKHKLLDSVASDFRYSIACSDCKHWVPNKINPDGGLGRCSIEAPASKRPGSLWPYSKEPIFCKKGFIDNNNK